MDVVKASFKPEFLNRLDEIVTFDALGTDELAHIVDLQVSALAQRLAVRRITLDVTAGRARVARADRLGSRVRSPAPAAARAAGDRRPARAFAAQR